MQIFIFLGIPSLGKALKKGKLGKGGPALEKKVLPVETDPTRIVSHLCGSCITKTGEDIKLKDDAEYPEWLWKLNTGWWWSIKVVASPSSGWVLRS
jgi:hypothetical protein